MHITVPIQNSHLRELLKQYDPVCLRAPRKGEEFCTGDKVVRATADYDTLDWRLIVRKRWAAPFDELPGVNYITVDKDGTINCFPDRPVHHLDGVWVSVSGPLLRIAAKPTATAGQTMQRFCEAFHCGIPVLQDDSVHNIWSRKTVDEDEA